MVVGGPEGEREKQWTEINPEATAKIQKKNERLDYGSSRGGENRSDSGYILKVQQKESTVRREK